MHAVVHDMAVRAHPHGAVGGVDIARQRFDRRHAAPADAAGKARRVGAEQRFAHHGMDAVGADHDIGLDRAAVGKARHRAALAGLDAAAALAEPDLGRCERLAQQVEQIGAVHGEVRRAEFLAEVAAADARNVTPAPPRADELEFRGPADVFDPSPRPSARNALTALGVRLMPAPISLSTDDCSQTMTSAPRRSSASAAASPPMPPPTMAMRGVRGMRGSSSNRPLFRCGRRFHPPYWPVSLTETSLWRIPEFSAGLPCR